MFLSKVLPFLKRFGIYLILPLLLVIIVLLIASRLITWNKSGQTVDLSDVDESAFDREVMDFFTPYSYTGEPVNDQDETVIAFFGNAPFADDAGTSDCLAEMIGTLADAKVYNFAVADSTLACEDYSIDYNAGDRDAFGLYWLTTIFTVDNQTIETNAKNSGRYSLEDLAVLSLLSNLDFNEVDVIAIMYDLTDYLEVRGMYNFDDSQNITHFGGALEASIALIQQYYPHIQIIVMSPTYGYALDADGNYADSSLITYGEEGPLGSYVTYECDVCYKMFCSFVDNFYGTISVVEAPDYLLDNKHISVAGRKLLADRFMEAYDYYFNHR